MITFGRAGFGVNGESFIGISGGVRSESCKSGGAGVESKLSSSDGSCDTTEAFEDEDTSTTVR